MANVFVRPAAVLALICLVVIATEAFEKPNGRFQLRNPRTGSCAGPTNDIPLASVYGGECSCDNVRQYWKISGISLIGYSLVSEGFTKQCMANWSLVPVSPTAGVTQCTCDLLPMHAWKFQPLEDGITFQLISEMGGSCVSLVSPGAPLSYGNCNPNDDTQKWIFYDACIGGPPVQVPDPGVISKITNILPFIG